MVDGKHAPTFEAHMNTAHGVENFDLSDPTNFIVLKAFRRELVERGYPIPQHAVYEVTPYILNHYMFLGIVQYGTEAHDPPDVEVAFMFVYDTDEKIMSLVAADRLEEYPDSTHAQLEEAEIIGLNRTALARSVLN